MNFPNPNPSLASVWTEIGTLEASYAVSLSRTRGSVATMHADAKMLFISLKALAGYVEFIANRDPETAETVIQSAGMFVKKPSLKPPKIFTVKQGTISGTVVVDSKAERYACYEYQLNTDPKKTPVGG